MMLLEQMGSRSTEKGSLKLCRKGLGGPGGHQVEKEPAMCPCHKESQWYRGLHYEECCQQVREGDPFPLHSPGEAKPGALRPVPGSPVRERHRHIGEGPTNGHEDDLGTGASLL